MKELLLFFGFFLVFFFDGAEAAPLTNAQTYGAAYSDAFRNGTPGMIMVKGTTDNNAYMLEADPTTGAIPVSGTFSLGYDTNYGTVGANTLRSAAQIGNASGGAAFNAGTTTTQTLRVVLPTDQSAIPVTESGTWDITNVSGTVSLPTGAATEDTLAKLPIAQGASLGSNAGPMVQGSVTTSAPTYTTGQIAPLSLTTTGAQRVDGSGVTQPVSLATVNPAGGRSSVLLYRNDYGSVNVTTGAYVDVIASTAGAINRLCDFDSSGSAIIVATGAIGVEVNKLYVPPGGSSQCYELAIPAATRISIKALDVDATQGQIILTGLN